MSCVLTKTEAPLLIPWSWRFMALGKTGRYINGLAFKPSDWGDEGLPIIRIQNLTDRTKPLNRTSRRVDAAYVVHPGDILVSWSATLDAFIWDRERALLNQHIFKVVPDESAVTRKFLFYTLKKAIAEMVKSEHLHGSTMKHINRGPFLAHEVGIPSIAAQEEIVAEIEKQFSRLDEAVASLQRIKANLKRYKASVLRAAAEGRLVATRGNWQQSKLGDVALSVRNGYSGKPDAEAGVRIFRISAVRPMELGLDDVRFLSGKLAEYGSFLAVEGDVLFTRYNGSRDYVGVCALVPAGLPPTVYPDKLIRVRVPPSILLPSFLVIAASTGQARDFIESKIRTTAGQSGVAGSDIKAIPLAIPCVDEQEAIVAEVDRRLSIVRELEAEVDANLKRAQALRQAILAKAFTP